MNEKSIVMLISKEILVLGIQNINKESFAMKQIDEYKNSVQF